MGGYYQADNIIQSANYITLYHQQVDNIKPPMKPPIDQYGPKSIAHLTAIHPPIEPPIGPPIKPTID